MTGRHPRGADVHHTSHSSACGAAAASQHVTVTYQEWKASWGMTLHHETPSGSHPLCTLTLNPHNSAAPKPYTHFLQRPHVLETHLESFFIIRTRSMSRVYHDVTWPTQGYTSLHTELSLGCALTNAMNLFCVSIARVWVRKYTLCAASQVK